MSEYLFTEAAAIAGRRARAAGIIGPDCCPYPDGREAELWHAGWREEDARRAEHLASDEYLAQRREHAVGRRAVLAKRLPAEPQPEPPPAKPEQPPLYHFLANNTDGAFYHHHVALEIDWQFSTHELIDECEAVLGQDADPVHPMFATMLLGLPEDMPPWLGDMRERLNVIEARHG